MSEIALFHGKSFIIQKACVGVVEMGTYRWCDLGTMEVCFAEVF